MSNIVMLWTHFFTTAERPVVIRATSLSPKSTTDTTLISWIEILKVLHGMQYPSSPHYLFYQTFPLFIFNSQA